MTSKFSIQAQDNATNLKGLLNALNERLINEDGFIITLELIHSISDETTITIMRGTTKDDVRTSIGDIGDDYLCLEELRGTALFMNCIPFTNIAQITFLEN